MRDTSYLKWAMKATASVKLRGNSRSTRKLDARSSPETIVPQTRKYFARSNQNVYQDSDMLEWLKGVNKWKCEHSDVAMSHMPGYEDLDCKWA